VPVPVSTPKGNFLARQVCMNPGSPCQSCIFSPSISPTAPYLNVKGEKNKKQRTLSVCALTPSPPRHLERDSTTKECSASFQLANLAAYMRTLAPFECGSRRANPRESPLAPLWQGGNHSRMRIRILSRVIKRATHLHLVYTGAPSSIKKLVPPFEGGKASSIYLSSKQGDSPSHPRPVLYGKVSRSFRESLVRNICRNRRQFVSNTGASQNFSYLLPHPEEFFSWPPPTVPERTIETGPYSSG
jgi:hypothetical protein